MATRPAARAAVPRHRRRGSRLAIRQRRRLGLVVVLTLAVAATGGAVWRPSGAAFSARDTNSANTFSARSSFPSYPNTILASGPVMYHRGDDAPSSSATSTMTDSSGSGRNGTYNGTTNGPSTWWKLDDASGTTAFDSSGAANTGTLAGGTTWVTGQSGSAVSLNGVDATVTGTDPAVATNRAFSIAAWAFLTDGSRDQVLVSQDGARRSAFSLSYVAAARSWTFATTTADTDAASTDAATSAANSATLNTWTHLTGVYDTSTNTLKLYVNGSLAASAAHSSTWDSGGDLVVGRALLAGAGTGWWSGSVDNVRGYRRALSASEVSTVAANGAPGGPMTAGVPGALHGTEASSTATAFEGTAGAYVNSGIPAQSSFTYECWFRVSGSQGGALLGLSDSQTGASTNTDRLVYLNSSGQLTFGVRPTSTTVATVTSPITYNDGAWHHVAVSMGSAGMRLYVDGVRVASDPSTTSAISYFGYSRVGGMSLAGYPNRPASDFVIGTIDEGSLIASQLSDATIAAHYDAR